MVQVRLTDAFHPSRAQRSGPLRLFIETAKELVTKMGGRGGGGNRTRRSELLGVASDAALPLAGAGRRLRAAEGRRALRAIANSGMGPPLGATGWCRWWASRTPLPSPGATSTPRRFSKTARCACGGATSSARWRTPRRARAPAPPGAVTYASTRLGPPQWAQARTSSAKVRRSSPAQSTRGVRSFVGSTPTALCAGPLPSFGFSSAPTRGNTASIPSIRYGHGLW